MKTEFSEYLARIGASQTLKARASSIYGFYEKVCPEQITRIFVSEYVAQDGTRVYDSLWFFSESFVMEAKGFLSIEDFDMGWIRTPVPYWRVVRQDYDCENATEKSRLSFHANFEPHTTSLAIELKASKENCDFLWALIKEFFAKSRKPE